MIAVNISINNKGFVMLVVMRLFIRVTVMLIITDAEKQRKIGLNRNHGEHFNNLQPTQKPMGNTRIKASSTDNAAPIIPKLSVRG